MSSLRHLCRQASSTPSVRKCQEWRSLLTFAPLLTALDAGLRPRVASKRNDQNAVQIRLTNQETERLDEWISSLQKGRLGGSGVSRTSLLRDLLVSEMGQRERVKTYVSRATVTIEQLRQLSFDNDYFILADIVADACHLLGSIGELRMQCSAKSIRILIETERSLQQIRSPGGDQSTVGVRDAAIGISQLLLMFLHEASVTYGVAAE